MHPTHKYTEFIPSTLPSPISINAPMRENSRNTILDYHLWAVQTERFRWQSAESRACGAGRTYAETLVA